MSFKHIFGAKSWHDLSFRLGFDENEAGIRRFTDPRAESIFLIQPNYSRPWGFDCSHWNGVVNMQTAKQNGARFVFVKARDGTIASKYFPENWAGARAAGIPRGAYCWIYPNARVSCLLQARAWWDAIKNDPGELPLVIDFEWTLYGGASANPSLGDLDIAVTEFNRLSPRKPLLYTAPGYISQFGRIPESLRDKFGGLWIAHWGTSSPSVPASFTNWAFQQYSSEMDGTIVGYNPLISKAADLNYCFSESTLASLVEGETPPPVEPPPDPIGEPRQRATVIVDGLNIRSGPGTAYEVVNGMTRNDVAFGNLDPKTNWFGLTLVWRAALDQIEEVTGWASAHPDYLSIQDIVPDDGNGEDDMSSVTYSNGVQIYTGRLNGHSDYELIIIPPSTIDKAGMFRPDGCRLVENVIGDKDLAFNFSPFNSSCTPNMGVRVNGNEYQLYDGLSQGSYAPFFWWDEANVLHIDHRKTTWKTLTSALQCWRYLIQNGAKNQNTSSAWNNQEPRRAVGRLPDGSTVLLSVCGRGYRNSQGATLHECADLLLQFGCDFALDGDSGGSVRNALRIDGQVQVFKGTSEDRGVPAGGVIKFKDPIVSEIDPEPDPEPPTGVLPFILDVDGYQPFSGELESDA